MGRKPLKFRHQVIDPDPPGSLHDITLIADINGDGRNEIIIGGKQGPPNLFWYENLSWKRHEVAAAPELEAGGVLLDIAGNGRLDLVAGQQIDGHELYWFECPADPTQPWTKRVITGRYHKYHDQAAGDVDGDGKLEVVFLSQKSGILAYYDIPDDPRVEPWPDECFHLIADGLSVNVEGLVVVDIDGDGVNEIIAGTTIYKPGRTKEAPWAARPFAESAGFRFPRTAVADLDADGVLEIVVVEGESDDGRLAVCHQPDLEPVILREGLFHPHSLAIADFDGDGLLDIFTAEMGLGENPDPVWLIFRNLGDGRFEEVEIARGIPTHEAKVGDLTGNGKPDIVGKPYDPERHIDVLFNET